MLDLLKRIVIFGIGIYAILFFGKLFFGNFSLNAFTTDLKGAVEDIHSIGQIGRNSSSSARSNSNSYDTANSQNPIVTTKGSESAITIKNLSRGNMVSPGDVIDGLALSSWFYEGVSTARFYDERGTLLGTSQMRAQADTTKSTRVPFTVVAQFTQGYAETGYVVFEKANAGGQPKNDAHYAFPITYPIKNGVTNPTSNTGTTFSQPQTTNTQNTNNPTNSNQGSNTLGAPVVNR